MARPKKLVSSALSKAQIRISGLKSLGGEVNLGPKLTQKAYEAEFIQLTADIEAYNTSLSSLDAKLNGIKAREKSLNAMSVYVLRRVAADHGVDSNEYEQVGGKRQSER